jgi:hypothetical protein
MSHGESVFWNSSTLTVTYAAASVEATMPMTAARLIGSNDHGERRVAREAREAPAGSST